MARRWNLPCRRFLPWWNLGNGATDCGAAPALADIPGLDQDMEQILAERKTARFREVRE